MRQDRASRTPHQSRAATERRPAAAEARQASSSSHARGQRQTIEQESFPAIHPPAHHIEHDAEPLAQRSPSEDARQSIPSDSRRAQTRQADKRSEEPSRPSKDDAHGRPRRRHDQGDARHATTREDRARRPSIPSDPEPMTARGRTATRRHTRGHQRPQEPRKAGRPPETAAAHGRAAGGRTRARGAKPTSLRDKSRRRTKEEGPPPSSGSRPPARAVCEALVSRPRVYGDRVEPITRNQAQVIAADIRHLRQQISRRHRTPPEHCRDVGRVTT